MKLTACYMEYYHQGIGASHHLFNILSGIASEDPNHLDDPIDGASFLSQNAGARVLGSPGWHWAFYIGQRIMEMKIVNFFGTLSPTCTSPSPSPSESNAHPTTTSSNTQDAPPTILPALLTRLLYHHFHDDTVRIGKDAKEVVGKYMDTFVREAIARRRLGGWRTVGWRLGDIFWG